MRKIFVIIVTYKGKRWYDKCFTSLRESVMPVQTVVVDNTPGKEDAEYIKKHHPDVHLIKPDENLGFGRANNLGMRYALDHGCDYVFLLNQDAWIEKDSIAKLVEVAEQHPEYGIISPMHMNAEMQQINMMYYDNNNNCDLVSDLYCGTLKEIYSVRYVNAAAWLLPRNTLETIGGFCPIIFQYGEDDDYTHRVLFHGYKIGLVPSSRIVHDSVHRVDLSMELYNRAQLDDVDGFLDINNNQSLGSLQRYLLRKRILCWIHRKTKDYQLYTHRYKYLCEHKNEIEQCRAAHKIKQANWL